MQYSTPPVTWLSAEGPRVFLGQKACHRKNRAVQYAGRSVQCRTVKCSAVQYTICDVADRRQAPGFLGQKACRSKNRAVQDATRKQMGRAYVAASWAEKVT